MLTIRLTFPLVVPFVVIDGYISDQICEQSKIIKAFKFIGAYMLQAIIAMAWSEPIDLDAIARFDTIIFLTVTAGAYLSTIFFYPLNNAIVITKYVARILIEEWINALFITLMLDVVAAFVIVFGALLKFSILIRCFSVISPVVFVLFCQANNELEESWGAAFTKSFFKVEPESDEKNIGELYCIRVSVASLLFCFAFHIIMG